jgi:rhodanese-related sulfurtransferase
MEWRRIAIAGIGFYLLWMSAMTALAEDVPRITKEELKGMLGHGDVVVIDVRANVDWIGSGFKIKGAVREDPRKLSSWMDKYSKDKTLVFYCS